MDGNKEGSKGVHFDGRSDIIETYNKMQDLVEKNGDLRDLINLPRIAVIGSQSSGKSSVLESLAGISFLPKGAGVVTRCPIILRMINTRKGNPWIEFEHLPSRKFEDFIDVEHEIIRQTRRVAGDGTNISHDPIKITVHSPNVLSFTVIDLPGIVKYPGGQQVEDIEDQIKDLIMSYIRDENTIILAVAKGNDDLVNAESIKMARSVDPTQSRTLAVVTKLDLAEDKEKMLDTLQGKIVDVKLGIVGVVNRSVKDLQSNKPLSEVLNFERNFILKNYPTVAWQHGMPVLARKLHKILSRRIAEYCPGLFSKLEKQQNKLEIELEALGEGCYSDDEKQSILCHAIDQFSEKYKAQVWGQDVTNVKEEGITRGRIIHEILSNSLSRALKSLEPFKGLSDAQLLLSVRNAIPVGSKMITLEAALNYFIRKAIRQIEPVAFNVARIIYHQMQDIIDTCLEKGPRYPKLNLAMRKVIVDLIEGRMISTKQVLQDYFEVQSCSRWTTNEGFESLLKEKMKSVAVVDTSNLSIKFLQNNGGMNLQEYLRMEEFISHKDPPVEKETLLDGDNEELSKEQTELCKQFRYLATEMFQIVKWQIQDFIGNAISTRLIDQTVKGVAVTLHIHLNKADKIEEMVQEGEDVQKRRMMLKKEIEYQTEALDLLDKVKSNAM